ncbi:hypothetical protein DCS_06353 [Drechmeria coniospora]|uniref:Acyltransferase 3 domain-containing protein n=1 Tax=Drechmeria coniospora TaxID=98403 RepID=A0A151GBH4_DRECN|nr:hypothetical protein DCS_06353 [Drechmeria coniospora]KYK54395.1 hypothetical protein DCS_06353 [Drechmeria coniospora]
MDFFKDAFLIILPSYLSRALQGRTAPSPKLTPTSSLNGLRGIAAVIVLLFHTIWAYSITVDLGYGYMGQNLSILQLPFLRIVHAGHAMVCIFFVVGGYVISLKPLRLMRQDRWDDLFKTVSSSLMRRGVRLYMPPLVATLVTAMTVHMGWWESGRANIAANRELFYYVDYQPVRQPTFLSQLDDWRSRVTPLFNLWGPQGYFGEYDPHLWTVPQEFRCSVLVTLALVAFAPFRTSCRWLFMFALIVYAAAWTRWEAVLFLAGAWLAEIDMVTNARSEKEGGDAANILVRWADETGNGSTIRLYSMLHRKMKTVAPPVIFLLGLYLMSCPPVAFHAAPGYAWLSSLIPENFQGEDRKRFIHGAGAIITVWAVCNSSTIQRPFLTRFAQYLGEISYSLYIVHGPFVHMISYAITPAIWRYFGTETTTKWAAGCFLGNLFTFVIIFWVADLFWRMVDTRSVEFSRLLEKLCVQTGSEK